MISYSDSIASKFRHSNKIAKNLFESKHFLKNDIYFAKFA